MDFEKVYLAPVDARGAASARPSSPTSSSSSTDQVDNARIPINPLGLTITYFREDQAFVNGQ